MRNHTVRVHRSDENLAHRDQLAHKLAEAALDPVAVDDEVASMVVNRVIDNAAVASAALTRHPVASARAQALAHPVSVGGVGATLFGASPSRRVSVEWAAWANGVAVRELDFHDTFLAAEYSHPADNIPPLIAVAQHAAGREVTGADLVRGIVAAYETQICLARGISLHAHKIDHIAHLGPSVAAGLGAMLGLDVETVAQAIGQALHTTTTTRQSRKGEISSWKAFAPAFAGKMAIEAVDRAMRGEGAPAPVYEGEDGVIARLLDGMDAAYSVPLPERGEVRRGILDSYTKEHSAEYQAQAWIDLARALREKYPLVFDKPGVVERVLIHTSHHTHSVIGSGANDPQKYDPAASRETLDHSLPYIFAVALQDGGWDHVESYTPERASRPDTVDLWQRIETVEAPEWTRRYHADDPTQKAFGGRVEIHLADGAVITDEVAVADAHPLGARPFARADYVRKFRSLADGVLADGEVDRFLGVAERLPELGAGELGELTFAARSRVMNATEVPGGIF